MDVMFRRMFSLNIRLNMTAQTVLHNTLWICFFSDAKDLAEISMASSERGSQIQVG